METLCAIEKKARNRNRSGFLLNSKKGKMKYLFTTLVFTLLIFSISPAQKTSKSFNAGMEVDALPYATGGWFAAAWAGKEKWRVRLLAASVNKPDFTTKKGFTNHHINAYALVADHFFDKEWKGWWLGGGLVVWKSRIQTDARLQTTSFTDYLLNGSAGYNIRLNNNIYLSPWAGMSIRIAGEKNIPVDNKHYTLPLLNPETSLKLGIWF